VSLPRQHRIAARAALAEERRDAPGEHDEVESAMPWLGGGRRHQLWNGSVIVTDYDIAPVELPGHSRLREQPPELVVHARASRK
jgi:hypothetical protein